MFLGWTDTAALPLLPGEASADVFAQLRKAPRLDQNDGDTWRARPYQELNATNDKKLMKLVEEQPDSIWPVFKGEAFDIWEPDRGIYYAWADPEKMIKHLQEKRARSAELELCLLRVHRLVLVPQPGHVACMRPRIAFHDVARNTDTRTVKVALIPPKSFWFILRRLSFGPAATSTMRRFCWAFLSSVPLDWYARRFVELHLHSTS